MPRAYIIVLCFLLSYLLILSLSFMYRPTFDMLITKPVQTIDAMRQAYAIRSTRFSPWFFMESRTDKKGVTVNDPLKSAQGYTFFTAADKNRAILIDMDGEPVQTWDAPFRTVFPTSALNWTPPADKIYLNRAYLQPNGDILVQYLPEGTPNLGYGLARIDRDSKVLWRYNGFAHHDVAVAPNGDIYALVSESRLTPHPALPKAAPPFLEEFIIVLGPDGSVKNRISILDMLAHSDAAQALAVIGRQAADPNMAPGDLLHPNTITIIPYSVAGRAPMLKAGNVLVSFRNISLLAVFDLAEKKATWASYGPWHAQHSPRFMPDGTVIMFDNEGNLSQPGGGSRILRVDLNDLAIKWQYAGTQDHPLYAPYNGFVDPLPGGNILVTETHAGRMFEITPDKEIVWEYYTPDRPQFDSVSRIPSVFSGRRFLAADLPFLQDASR